jgi:hypothetical protein
VFFLLAVVPTATAIDPGRASGYVSTDGERIELREAFAHLHRNADGRLPFTPELRILLADREVPQSSLAGLEALPVLELARTGQVRGLLIRLDPDEPGAVQVTLLVAPQATDGPLVPVRYSSRDAPVVRQLKLSPTRVGGTVACPAAWEVKCSVQVSAPVFNE